MGILRYPRLRYPSRAGFQVASDAVVLCFYFQRAHMQIAPAVMRALEIFRQRIRPLTLDWYIDYDGYTHPLDEKRWEALRKEMLGDEEGVGLRLAATPEGPGGIYVDYRGLPIVPMPWPERARDVSCLYLRLPTDYLEEQGQARVREVVLDIANELPFNSGYAGLVFCEVGAAEAGVDLVRRRYPGIHIAREGPHLDMHTCIDGVHWMNFLGQPVLGQLGGVSALRERLDLPGISIHELSGERVLITLGEQPETGDQEAGQTLPLHHALAQLLEPFLYRSKWPLGCMTPEDMRRWERRFLD